MARKRPFRLDRPTEGHPALVRPEHSALSDAMSDPGPPLLVVCAARDGGSLLGATAAAEAEGRGRLVRQVDLLGSSALADVARRIDLETAEPLAEAPTDAEGSPDRRRLRGLPPLAQARALAAALGRFDRRAGDLGGGALFLDGLIPSDWERDEPAVVVVREAFHGLRATRVVVLVRDGASLGERLGFDVLDVKPVPSEDLSAWVSNGFHAAGVKAKRSVARGVVLLAGPRFGDVARLAQGTLHGTQGLAGKKATVKESAVLSALDRLADDSLGLHRWAWEGVTPLQQNLLRAMAAGESRLFSRDVRGRHDLRSSATVARAIELLTQKGLVHRSGDGYHFDSPFMRRWVELKAVPDLS